VSDILDEVPFEVLAERTGVAVRMRVTGELDLNREGELHAAVDEVLATGGLDRLILDVQGLQFIDSSGLRALLTCRDRARAAGVTFRLAVSPGPVTRLLAVAGVQSWFDYE
jgi:anti-sigma B factor antagonist